MGADGRRPAQLVRAAAVAACALLAVSAAVIGTAWQYSATPSARYVLAARIASSPTAPSVFADVSDARMNAATFVATEQPWWVDHGSSCPADVTEPLWVSHGSGAH